jgi:membrane peptidoglycan carboxypeptidase
MNDMLKQTIVLIEDSRFYTHFGIDPIAMIRAFIVNTRERRYSQGGSTITQQLARTLYLNNKKNLSRKIREILLAFYLEFTLTKSQILDMYMSEVYMGHDKKGRKIKGFEDASFYYFRISVKDLSVAQIASLVAMLKGPNMYKPTSKAGKIRKVTVLTKMLDFNLIALKEFYEAI